MSPYGDEIGKCKTALVKADIEPTYDSRFVFQVRGSDVSLVEGRAER